MHLRFQLHLHLHLPFPGARPSQEPVLLTSVLLLACLTTTVRLVNRSAFGGMRKLRAGGGGERVGTLAYEVAGLMSRAATLWRALGGDDPVSRLRGEAVRFDGVRRLVLVAVTGTTDDGDGDDAQLLALALAEMAGACRDIARSVARLSGRCADPLLRRFGDLFTGLVAGGADPHGLRYAAAGKMDRKARKMQRLVAATGYLCEELDVLAELEQGARLHRAQFAGPHEAARRVARHRQEVERIRAASLWSRSFDYAVRLLARSLFTIVARIIQVFGLEPKDAVAGDGDGYCMASSLAGARLSFSWSGSFAGSSKSLVYPSHSPADTPQRSTSAAAKSGNGDVRRFLRSSSQSFKQQLKWPAAGKHLIGCMVSRRKSPVMQGWVHGEHESAPLSFSYVSGSMDDFCASFQSQETHNHRRQSNRKLSTSVFDYSSHDVLMNAPATTLGAAALASHYANLVVFVEKLAVSPRHICPDERDALYDMLTDRIRASLRARLRPTPPFAAKKKKNTTPCDPDFAAEWAGTVQGILDWLAPLAHNTVRWRSERSFEQRNNVSSSGGGATGVLLLQTLHYADQEKAEAAIAELLVGLNYLWRYAAEFDAATAKGGRSEAAPEGNNESYYDCAEYIG